VLLLLLTMMMMMMMMMMAPCRHDTHSTLYCMRYEIIIKKIRNFDCVHTMQSVITDNLFQNFQITYF